jgi:hypothetical protein
VIGGPIARRRWIGLMNQSTVGFRPRARGRTETETKIIIANSFDMTVEIFLHLGCNNDHFKVYNYKMFCINYIIFYSDYLMWQYFILGKSYGFALMIGLSKGFVRFDYNKRNCETTNFSWSRGHFAEYFLHQKKKNILKSLKFCFFGVVIHPQLFPTR